jgi:hypothetical protein
MSARRKNIGDPQAKPKVKRPHQQRDAKPAER